MDSSFMLTRAKIIIKNTIRNVYVYKFANEFNLFIVLWPY